MYSNESVLPNASGSLLLQLNNNMTMALLPVTILIGLESIIGCVGNVLILIIYSKYYERNNFRCFVLSIALVDLTNCLTAMPIEMFGQCHWYIFEHAWLCKVKSYFLVLTTWGSATILSLLAFDRHRKVYHPLKWQIQPSLALKLCMASFAISGCVAIPTTITWGKRSYIYLHHGIPINVSICEKSGQYADSIYPFVYLSCVYTVPIGLMLCFLSFVNIRIARKLFWRLNRKNNCPARFLRSSSEIKIISATNNSASVVYNQRKNVGEDKNCRKLTITQSETQHDNQLANYSNDESELSAGIILNAMRKLKLSDDPKTIRTVNGAEVNKRRSTTRSRRKRKTIIMLILTSVYVTTMTVYVVLISIVAREEELVNNLSNLKKVVFFLFLRLFFINSAVNSVLYGVLDPRFRQGLRKCFLEKQ